MQDKRILPAAVVQDILRELKRLDPPAPRPPTKATRILNAKIDEGLANLKTKYLACKKDRRKTAILPYLKAVYAFGLRFENKKQSRYLKEQAARTGGPKARKKDSIFAYLLRATSTANRKTRNTWVQALEIAHSQEVFDRDLADAMREAGGLKNYIRAFAGQGVNEAGDEEDGWEDGEGWRDDEDFELNDHIRTDLQRSVPAAPKAALMEAIRCFDIRVYTATVLMCGLTLQRACKARGIEAAGDIGAALDGLRQSGLVDATLVDQSRENAVRVMEIVYAEQPLVTRKEAVELLEFTRTVVDALYPELASS